MLNLASLDAWLKVNTWDTNHPCDEERFYKAIYRVIIENEQLVNPDKIESYIIEYKQGKSPKNHIEEVARTYANKYDSVMSFLYENKIELRELIK